MKDTSPVDRIRPINKEYLETDEYPTIHVETQAGTTIDFCGVEHSNDPDGYMINRVRQEFGDFLSKPSGHEKLVMLEGWRGPRIAMDDLPESEMVQQAGEEALADRMARQAGVEIVSPEPPVDKEFQQLCQEFPSNQVFYWYAARQAVQWGREHPVDPESTAGQRAERHEIVQEKLEYLTSRLEETLGHPPSFRETTASLEMLQATHEELFGGELDWDDIEHFNDHANPIDENSVINKIHNRSNQIRDEHILAEIAKASHAGKDIFAVYGDGHAYTLEPALRTL